MTKVLVTVIRDGTIQEVRIIEADQNDAFNQAVLAAFGKVKRFRKFPASYKGMEAEFTLTIRWPQNPLVFQNVIVLPQLKR